jgi:sec-independent protein translocase protein TatA
MKTEFLFLSGLGMQEILLIGLFILIFFGANKVPDFMKSIGKGLREYRNVMNDAKKEVNSMKQELPKLD